MASFFPERAVRLEVEGHVLLTCKVTDGGHLTDCIVTKETPAGYDFGDAALRMSPWLRMRPSVAGGTVRVPLAFRFPDSELTAKLTMDEALVCYGYWSMRIRVWSIGGPRYMQYLFANEVKWQARLAGASERQIEDSLAAARNSASKRAPMPRKCAW